MKDTLSKFMSESAKRHEENSNLIKEIRASTDVAIRNNGASIKTLEIQIEQMSKVLQERGFGSLPSSTEVNLRDQVKSISTILKLIHTRYAVLDPPNTPYLLDRILTLKLRISIIPYLEGERPREFVGAK
ncbi:hypothetical protein Tco_0895000 [Tanacetum coccineum]|uniref:Uncharacterized protein n=1 Tax=Tanacetum coccineum TaxID=301880 RepID=A0ABQ5CGK9_9ASTR